MLKTCVIVADAARARLFVTEPPAERTLGHAPVTLRELESLTNPEGELTGLETFSNSRSGTNRSPHGAAFEYDDHRSAHREETERRFARVVASAVRDLLEREHAPRCVLAVAPHMLGLLRPALSEARLPAEVQRVDVAADLSRHAPAQILEALQRHGALAAEPPSR
jgi:protein required for attachment to host cells